MHRIIAVLCQCLVLAVLWQPSVIIAAEEKPVDCTVEPYNGTLFVTLYKTTEQTARTFCTELIRSRVGQNAVDNALIGSILKDFAMKSEQALDKLKLNNSADYKEQFEAVKETFRHFDFENIAMPEFKVMPSMSDGTTGFFEPLEESTNRFVIKEVAYCATVSPGSSCKDIFRDFASAFNPYRSAYNNVYDNSKQLSEMGKRWDAFLEVSKSQTALEVWLTTWANNKHFKKDHLVGPPGYQIIALHPQLVYDSLKKAPDGSNQELGLAVEWAGVNFWDLKVPLGISLASVYVDRANVRDVGHGAMVHINNHYAIGWANYGRNENSVYVTIDLLKMFEEKKAKYDEYVNNYF